MALHYFLQYDVQILCIALMFSIFRVCISTAIDFTSPKLDEFSLIMENGEILLTSWLNRSVHIEIFDERKFIGKFLCTDREGAAILSNTTEYNKGFSRALGLVVIPGKHIKSFSVRA
nr:putative NatC N-acetyltransferase non-catalytic subunit Naa38 [Schizosaccharomyces pombe]O43080.2 RecName: Full=N-alpha-acetyltransferase 38, NatC auxiliary subunit; AltName: Full=N-terminal acetyltransferase C complex subunit naa38 [Schizosaccharomyces pombe 972h-]CAA17031.2 NatC N-acetyltransferase non catalytic Sm-like domain subunit Naa38 (predicted) [Schizosaccharomyces pombe]|eukprot:NP_595273.2 putative NatC N-acetyltransferase non-catalytic subunit Naa38 [Schizosaccharomyces pombe]